MSKTPPNPYGLTDRYWTSLTPAERTLYEEVRPLRRSNYVVDIHLGRMELTLADLQEQSVSRGGSFDLNPDFQRGHVWTREQQVAFIESYLRGLAPAQLRFNAPSYGSEKNVQGMHLYDFVCIDGLQRLTALRAFMNDEFEVFGKYRASALKETPFDPSLMTWKMEVFTITNRADLLQFYLDINSGGTVHSPEELARVRALRDEGAAPKVVATVAKKARAHR